MKKFILLGELGEKFGKEHLFRVSSVSEGIRALRANFKDFEKYLVTSSDRGVGYRVHVNSAPILEDQEVVFPLGNQNEIVIAPAIFGSSGTAKIIVGVVLVAAGIIFAKFLGPAAPYVIGAGVALITGGIIQLLSPLPRLGSPKEAEQNKPSYLFTGPVNTQAQGEPVPILYGRMIIGSAVISAGIVVEEIDE